MFLKSASSFKESINKLILAKSKFNIFLDCCLIALFGAVIASIPIFSFNFSGKIITWVLTILMLCIIGISFILYYDIKIDAINVSLILFVFSSLLSSLMTGFAAFKITAPLLAVISAIMYTYVKSNKNVFEPMMFSAFIGIIIFLAIFVYQYRNELFHLNFTRLGSFFGDDNDISLFMAFGLTLSVFFGIFKRGILINVFSLILIPLFMLCGFATGSKIFILITLLLIIAYPILFLGKKKWWLVPILIFALIVLFVCVINLPFLSTIKNRMLDLISTLFGSSVNGGNTGELSTINRFNMFCCGMEMFAKRPMFGWGIWGFATFSGRAGGWSHNNISESFCNFGLIGTILFHFGFFVSIKEYLNSKKKKNLLLPFVLILFYLVCMLSVALNSQKLYSYIIGLCFAKICNCKDIKVLDFKFFRKRASK